MMNETVNRCEALLAQWLREAFRSAFGDAQQDWSTLRVQPATDTRFGDFQCNDAMPLAKVLRQPPRQIAEAALRALPLPPMLTSATVAGAGFINLTVNPVWLAGQLAALAATPHFGIPDIGRGQTVVIDYSSPNVAKPMHIGHIRSTVIGNALDRIYRALGYRVIADNHLGDWGTQFGLLIQGYRTFLSDAERETLTVETLEQVYVQSYNRSKEDPAWLDACKAELVKLQQGDPENRAIWERFIAISRQEFDRVYERLDVRFDLTRGESYYNDILPETIRLLQEKGLAQESEGALVVNLEAEGMPVCIVRKSDGGFNYAATDIATVRSRMAEFRPDRIVYVTDERQQLHFRQFFAVCAKLGCTARLEHVWFGLMRLPEGTFSTRQGNVIKLEVLLDEAERRALEIIRAAHTGMPEAQQRELAAAIGIGAIKYADLSHDPQTLIVFTWEKALALEGNSGPYLQYAHARVCSLLDKYAEQVPGSDPNSNTLLLDAPVEKELALRLLQFPAVVTRAAETFKPSVLADYLFGLSQTYSSFYQRSPVLKAEPAVRDSRIRLCAMTAQVLAEGLGLLGIRAPRRI
ncbi:MAG TPA: arginine--tRNA ligase [Kiritimatiellia bacterium]|nr:arginine--tRNA ligase [Kiritimatiellia bacterium]HOM59081.1 arginine--tRNA ligase [Kiritimatiellia bacterium]HRU19917.1 arginine--tRNA ligase [Kiritimatiellia bacterium]